ncbi:hypothetical protein E1287_17195 [Actinomadura sp. KC06]|uniref:SAM-dependent methyltransferase n=1 Tax=Actinomadura sp. KC06 TaxID=2530369 RepID=UPI00104FE5A7|nr:hypothetical protein E1287_17195 [Actinomadura sp. KC06]
MLISTSEGATDYIRADMRAPDRILHRPAHSWDFDPPVAFSSPTPLPVRVSCAGPMTSPPRWCGANS